MGVLSEEEAERIRRVIVRMGLPVESGVDVKRLLKALKLDKKRDADRISLVLIDRVGSCEIRKTPFAELEKLFV